MLALLSAAPALAATDTPRDHLLKRPDTEAISENFGTNDSSVIRSLTVAQLQGLAAQKLNQDIVTRLFGPLPPWLQRIEVTGNFDLDGWRGLEIMTVQPLWRGAAQDKIVFTQLSLTNYRMFDRQRFAGNAGIGYRQLLDNDRLLLGGNVFYDHEFLRGHHRLGIGLEAKYGPLDFSTNGYLGLNQRSLGDGSIERVPNGLDIELGTQLPYLPWAKIYGKYYVWDHKLEDKRVRGAQVSAEANLHRYLSVEGGARHDVGGKGEGFLMLRLKLNRETMPGLLEGAPLLADQAFTARDLHQAMLSKVRRENRIILERSRSLTAGSGLTVTVSRGH